MQPDYLKPKLVPFTERSKTTIFVDYLVLTSTNGLRNVGLAPTKPYRFAWILLLLAAFGFMLYFVISSVLQYIAYPTQTNVEIEAQQDMIFPAVTVCNANPYRTDKLLPVLNRYAQYWGFNFTAINPADLVMPVIVDLFNRNDRSTLTNIGFQLEDMLLGCSYNGIDCRDQFVRSTSSVLGNCFTFNWNTSFAKLVTLDDAAPTFLLFNGLILSFYVPRELNDLLDFSDDGLIVLLHENNELPQMVTNGLRLQLGLSHTISFRKSETHFLPKPYTECTSVIEADQRALHATTFNSDTVEPVTYSKLVCQELCRQSFIFSRCSCILPIPFFTRYVFNLQRDHLLMANTCLPYTAQVQCGVVANQQLSSNSSLWSTWCSHCVSQCRYTHFISELSAVNGLTLAQKRYWADALLKNGSNANTTVALPNDFAANYSSYMDSNYLSVSITCGSRYVTINRQEAKITIIDTIAAIGGQTGLWFGLSVLGLFEFFELVFWLVVKVILTLKRA